MATTLVGLGSLLVNRIAAIQEFVLMAGFGLFSLLPVIFAVFPAGLAMLPLPRNKRGCHR